MKVRNILVSQPRPQSENSPYYDMQERYGVHFEFHQLIRTEVLTPKEFRAQRIDILDYSAIIFNSKNCIDHFFALCKEMRVAIPDSMHYYCVSESVANYLQKHIQFRKRKVFFAPNNKMDGLPAIMQRRPDDKFLMAVADGSNDNVIQMFASHKLQVKPVVLYRTVSNEFAPEEKLDYDMFVIFTPAGVEGFRKNYPDFNQGERIMACFGAKTAQALRDAGLRVDIEAPSAEYPSITAAVDAFLKENHKRIR